MGCGSCARQPGSDRNIYVNRAEAKARTHRALIEAAADEVVAHGLRGARIERIAAAAGVTTGALYANFGSKRGLLDALREDLQQQLKGEYGDLVAASTPAEAAHAADIWLQRRSKRPRRLLVSLELLLHADELDVQEEVRQLRGAGRNMIADVMAEAVPAADPDDVAELAFIILALGNGLSLEYLSDPGSVPEGLMARWALRLLQSLPQSTTTELTTTRPGSTEPTPDP